VSPAPVVAVLAPMWTELAPLVRPLGLRRDGSGAGARLHGTVGPTPVVAAQIGVGPGAAKRATERLLAGCDVAHVLVVGVAGAIAPGLDIGELVVPERVLELESGDVYHPHPLGDAPARGVLATSASLVTDPGRIAALAREGVQAIDMETAAVAAACERAGRPWSVLRAISDRAGDRGVGPEVLGLVREDGSPDVVAALRFLAARPWRVPLLVRLARDSGRAARSAAAAALRALERGVPEPGGRTR